MDHGSTETTRVGMKMCGGGQLPPAPVLSAMEDRSIPLVRAFLATGSDHDFSVLAREIAPRLLRYCRAQGASGADAEDIVQDVLYTVYCKVWSIRELNLFWSWLFQVARNAQLQQIRRSNRQLPINSLDPLEEANLPAKISAPGKSGEEFVSWMELLEPGERDVMVLRYVEDFEYHEIAQTLSIPIGTVKSRLFHAKKKLTKQLTAPQPALQKSIGLVTGGPRGKK